VALDVFEEELGEDVHLVEGQLPQPQLEAGPSPARAG
jgi:hypothetical protein